jgi:hypothetical protein
MTKSYYAGMEIDAPCGRCKSETTHRISSITDGVPERLICTICNSIHKFREAKPAKEPRTVAPRVLTRAAPSPSRFQELMISEQAGARSLPYTVTTRWEEGQWLDHPAFGLGRVQRRTGRKVEVLFRDGLKTLISG